MTVKYAQGKIGEAAMAQFYLNWAKKVPQNSEFYRALQRDAGQFMRAAKAKRAVRQRDTTEQDYQNRMMALERKHERPGQEALRVVTMLAQAGGVIGESPLGNASQIAQRTNLANLQIGGVEQVLGLLGSAMIEQPNMTEVAGPATIDARQPDKGFVFVRALESRLPQP